MGQGYMDPKPIDPRYKAPPGRGCPRTQRHLASRLPPSFLIDLTAQRTKFFLSVRRVSVIGWAGFRLCAGAGAGAVVGVRVGTLIGRRGRVLGGVRFGRRRFCAPRCVGENSEYRFGVEGAGHGSLRGWAHRAENLGGFFDLQGAIRELGDHVIGCP